MGYQELNIQRNRRMLNEEHGDSEEKINVAQSHGYKLPKIGSPDFEEPHFKMTHPNGAKLHLHNKGWNLNSHGMNTSGHDSEDLNNHLKRIHGPTSFLKKPSTD